MRVSSSASMVSFRAPFWPALVRTHNPFYPSRTRTSAVPQKRWNTSGEMKVEPSEERNPEKKQPVDIEALLSTPTWSVQSLLPSAEDVLKDPPVTAEQLRHLLRLSALPEPKSADEEAEMLRTLASQLHFVREIQKVDTTGVEPLRALRDETQAAEKENEITIESLKAAFAQEELVGKHHKRIRRSQESRLPTDNPQGWKPLDHAQRKVGNFFVVDNGQSSKTQD